MQIIYSTIILTIYLLVLVLEIILTVVERLIYIAFRKEKLQIVKETYPNLSENDLKFRRMSLYNYQRIYFDNSNRNKIRYIMTIMLIFIIIGTAGSILSDSFSNMFFCID